MQILQGAQEYGKDIVFSTIGPLNDTVNCACVVKNHRISGKVGDSRSASVVLEQIEQALEIPYLDGAASKISVQRVYVISPEEIGQSTIRSVEAKLSSRGGQVVFLGGSRLLELFELYWPDFFADEYNAVERYLTDLATQPTNVSLPELVSLYGLGEVDKQEAAIYVERSFHRQISAYDFDTLFDALPDRLPLRVDQNNMEADLLIGRIQDLRKRLAHFATWGYVAPAPTPYEIDTEVARFEARVREGWRKAARRAQLAHEGRQGHTIPSYIQAPPDSDGSLGADAAALAAKLRAWLVPARVLCRITQALSRHDIVTTQLFATPEWEMASRFDDCLQAAALRFSAASDTAEVAFAEGDIRAINQNLMLVGAAGYGKTSFCRRNCLVDARQLREGGSKTFPIYVPLHTLATAQCTSFADLFLRGLGRSALLDEQLLREADRVRLYLDGLDEIPSESQQRRLLELACLGRPTGGTMQVIVTARDYLFAEWLHGFRRIELGTLTARELEELKEKWFGAESSLGGSFDGQISKLPALLAILKVPLLATLVLLVFRQTRTLPESRARLYGTFVDLLSGGWDLAKGVLRPSNFGRGVKLMVLADLASTAHVMGQRDFPAEMIDASVTRIIAKADEALQVKFRKELLIDGLITRAGAQYCFGHHSFQEFLAAKYMTGDPSAREASSALRKFVYGSDWWQEVLRFYVGLSENPELVTRWIVGQLEKSRAPKERAVVLLAAVREFFPSFDVVSFVHEIGKGFAISAAKLLAADSAEADSGQAS